jgi:phosphorylcholine metabolism protein LicD
VFKKSISTVIEDLRTIKSVLDSMGLPLYLCYGTALGAYRDGDFLPEPQDLDIGTTDKENRFEVWNRLQKLGFISRVKPTRKIEHYGMLPIKRNTEIDFFFFDKEGCSYALGNNVCAIVHNPPVFEPITFKGDQYLIPSPVDEYLTHCYGDWEDKNNRCHGI